MMAMNFKLWTTESGHTLDEILKLLKSRVQTDWLIENFQIKASKLILKKQNLRGQKLSEVSDWMNENLGKILENQFHNKFFALLEIYRMTSWLFKMHLDLITKSGRSALS